MRPEAGQMSRAVELDVGTEEIGGRIALTGETIEC
jgi:hypothetical protein